MIATPPPQGLDVSGIEEVTRGEENSFMDLESELQAMAAKLHQRGHFNEVSQLQKYSVKPTHSRSQSYSQLTGSSSRRTPDSVPRHYPQINPKSQALAAKADARFFSKHSPRPRAVSLSLRPIPRPQIVPTPPVIVPPESVSTVEPRSEELRHVTTPQKLSLKERIAAYLAAPTDKSPEAAPPEPAISQRSRDWLQKREQKLKSLSNVPTFTPVIYTQIPHHMHKMSADRLVSFARDAKQQAKSSQNTSRVDVRRKATMEQPPKAQVYTKSLSPVVQQLAFASGCNFDSLKQRQVSQNLAYD